MSEYHGDAKYRPKRYQSIGKLFKKRIPIVSWLPKYDADQAVSDLIAGVTVGLTVMPQGLAYATLAGLEPQVRRIFIYSRRSEFEKIFKCLRFSSYNNTHKLANY